VLPSSHRWQPSRFAEGDGVLRRRQRARDCAHRSSPVPGGRRTVCRALRKSGAYGVALACAAGSMMLLAAPLLGMDALRWNGVGHVLSVRSLSLPWLTLGRAVSLLLAVASVSIAILPRGDGPAHSLDHARSAWRHRWFCRRRRLCHHAQQSAAELRRRWVPGSAGRGGRIWQARQRRNWLRAYPREGLSLVRTVSLAQAAWVFGPPLLGAGAGLIAAWGSAGLW